MIRDKNGNPLREGDEVIIRAFVRHIEPPEKKLVANVQLECLEPYPQPVFIQLNSRQVERVKGLTPTADIIEEIRERRGE